MATTDFRGTSYSQGIRHNNPGNLRPSGSNWQGQVGTENNFVVFSDMIYGCRALGTDLTNKYYRGLQTVQDIIGAYAPPSENNTQSYINAVASALNVNPGDVLTWDNPTLALFMRAVIQHENGADGSYVTDDMISQGIAAMNPTLLLKIQGAVQGF